MKTKVLLILTLVLVIAIGAVGLTACNDNGDESPDTSVKERYLTSKTLTWKAEGEYTFSIAIEDSANDSFVDFSSADFFMTAFKNSESSVSINDFEVTKTDSKTLTASFSSPFESPFDYTFFLATDKGVTKNNYSVGAFLYVTMSELLENVTATGAYSGSEKTEITVETNSESPFAAEISENLVTFPGGYDFDYSMVRVDDTHAKLTVNNPPTDLTAADVLIKLTAAAFNCEFAEDVEFYVSFKQPRATVMQDSVVYDADAKTLTIGNIAIAAPFVGKANGLQLKDNTYASIVSQSYDENSNSHSVTLSIVPHETYGAEYSLRAIELDVFMKNGDDEFTYECYPYLASCTVIGELTTDVEENTLSATLTLENGTFADGLTLGDFTVSGAEGLENFRLVSCEGKIAVFAADYSEDFLNSTFLTIGFASEKINANFANDEYSVVFFVPHYFDGRDVDWKALGAELGVSLAGTLGSEIGSAAVSFALPYVYEYFGIDTSDQAIQALSDKINSISQQISSLSYEINRVAGYIEIGTDKVLLQDYQKYETNLSTYMNTLLKNNDVRAYANALGDIPDNYSQEGEEGFNAFYGFVTSFFAGDPSACPNKTYLIDRYNYYVDAINGGRYVMDMYSFCRRYDSDFNRGKPLERVGAMQVYNFCLGRVKYVPLPDYSAVDATAFIAAVDAKVPTTYIADVRNLGQMILNTSAGTNAGVIEMYFNVLDSTFNFQSETISAKKAFVGKLQSTYFLNASLALQYCDATDDANGLVLRNQIKEVATHIQKVYAQIAVMDARAAKGNDIILVSNQEISKTLLNIKISDARGLGNASLKSLTKDGHIAISADTLSQMALRASKLGVTMAKELTDAGFTKPRANNETTGEYLFIGNLASDEEKEERSGFSTGWGSFKNIFGGDRYWTYKFQLFTVALKQTGTSPAVALDKERLWYGTEYNDWYGNPSSDFTYDYTWIVAFNTPKA